MSQRLIRAFALLLTAGLLGACSTTREALQAKDGALDTSRTTLEVVLEHDMLVRVKPWERELLALEDMRWLPDRLEALRRSHIHYSKEGSLAGGSAGGGGCGCN